MPRIPSAFNPHDWEQHLRFSEDHGVMEAHWPLAGVSIYYPKPTEKWKVAPDRAEVSACTPQLAFHGHHGYSVGPFSEFFVYAGREPNPVSFTMGTIEGSFGQVTPLAHLLYHYGHDDDLEGEFSAYQSIRLFGCTKHNAEAALISAVVFLEKQHGLTCEVFPVGNAEWPEEEAYTGEEKELEFPNPFSDVEPLRMLFRGRQERDPESAFLQLYRILEYYSVLTLETQVAAMRSDHGLSTRQFLLDVHQLVGRDEKTTLGRMMALVADTPMLTRGRDSGLIGEATANALTNAVYDFRNSVVHAKSDHRAKLFSESIFVDESKATAWKRMSEELAWKAITAFGSRVA